MLDLVVDHLHQLSGDRAYETGAVYLANPADNALSRFKPPVGVKLPVRIFENQQVEAHGKCQVLSRLEERPRPGGTRSR